jgi:hypothetical protein
MQHRRLWCHNFSNEFSPLRSSSESEGGWSEECLNIVKKIFGCHGNEIFRIKNEYDILMTVDY